MSVYKAGNQQLEIWHDSGSESAIYDWHKEEYICKECWQGKTLRAIHGYVDDSDIIDNSPSCAKCGNDIETSAGYYAALGHPGCLFDSGIMGPYDTEEEAYNDINATLFDNELEPFND